MPMDAQPPAESQKDIDYSARAAIYDLEYTDSRNYPFLLNLIDETVQAVVDVPCGCGRHAEMMARTGRRIVAVDVEPLMIEEVWRRVRRTGLSNIIPMVGDMRSLSVPFPTDLLITAPEAFQFLTGTADAQQALGAFAASINLQGRIVLDLSPYRRANDPKLEYYDPALLDGVEIEEWSKPFERDERITRWRTQFHPADNIVEVRFRYESVSPRGRRHWVASMTFRIFRPEELRPMIEEAGLTILQAFGDYDGSELSAASPRMIYVLGRAAGTHAQEAA